MISYDNYTKYSYKYVTLFVANNSMYILFAIVT